MSELLSTRLGLPGSVAMGPVDIYNHNDPALPAIATLRVFYQFQASSAALKIPEGSDYRGFRWLDKTRPLNDLTFANPEDRQVVERQLQALQQPWLRCLLE